MEMKSLVFAIGLVAIAAPAALAQSLPPTTQELQQQHNQTIQNETNAAHGNLTQLQIQTPPPPQPTFTPYSPGLAHPPGYVPTPHR